MKVLISLWLTLTWFGLCGIVVESRLDGRPPMGKEEVPQQDDRLLENDVEVHEDNFITVKGQTFRHDPRFLTAHEDSTVVENEFIIQMALGHHEVDLNDLLDDFTSAFPQANIVHVYRYVFWGFAVDNVHEAHIRSFLADHPRANLLAEPSILLYAEQQQQQEDTGNEFIQTNAPWGLDRLDAEIDSATKLDQIFRLPSGVDGSGVDIYVLDSGIRLSHNEFTTSNSPSNDAIGVDCTNGCRANGWEDTDGHGTLVAGIAAGTTYGIAKRATVIPVKVLRDRSGSLSWIVAAIDWVEQQHAKTSRPSVMNLSLGGGRSTTLDNAINDAVGKGVVVVVAAGNENSDACNTSPARAAKAITVGSTTSQDYRSSFSNYGACVDIFAPGSSIRSASANNDSAERTSSGTSMSSPFVAGAAALLLQQDSSLSVEGVLETLKSLALEDALKNIGSGSPNLLLNVAGIGASSASPPNFPSANNAPASPISEEEVLYPLTVFTTYDASYSSTSWSVRQWDAKNRGWKEIFTAAPPATFPTDTVAVTLSLKAGYTRFYISDSSEASGLFVKLVAGDAQEAANRKPFAAGSVSRRSYADFQLESLFENTHTEA